MLGRSVVGSNRAGFPKQIAGSHTFGSPDGVDSDRNWTRPRPNSSGHRPNRLRFKNKYIHIYICIYIHKFVALFIVHTCYTPGFGDEPRPWDLTNTQSL